MTFEEFSATGRDVADLGDALSDDGLNATAGRIYLDALYIARWEDDRHGIAPPNGPTWTLILGRDEWQGDLDDLEPRLYHWAKTEGYFDKPGQPVERIWFIGHKTKPLGYSSWGERRWACPSNDYVDLFTDSERAERDKRPLPRGGEWVESEHSEGVS